MDGGLGSSMTLFQGNLVDTQEHHGMLRDNVGKLAGGFGRSYFQKCVKEGRKPVELWDALGQGGFLGVHVDEKYGGGGGGLADYNVIVEEVAAQGCPILSLVIGSICAPIIQANASEALKEEWLPGLANGTKRLAFAITEPDAGTNTHKISTTARKDGDGWTLSGTKYWTSAVDESEAIMVVARTGEPDARGRGQAFAVHPAVGCAGADAHPDRDGAGRARNPVHAVLRQREGARRRADRHRRRGHAQPFCRSEP